MATAGESRGRPLGDTEMFYEFMQSKEKTNIYVHTAIFKSRVLLTEEIVRKSLQILAKFQPLLQMKIVKETDEQGQETMRYTEMEKDVIDMETIKVPNTSAWVDIATRSVNFDSEKGPLWKVVLAHVEEDPPAKNEWHSDIMVFFIHHGITDAVGAVDLIYRQFLPILNGVVEDGNLSAYESPLPVAAPFEDHFVPEKDRGQAAPWYMRLIMNFLRWKNRGGSNNVKTIIRTTEESYKNITEKPLIPFLYSEELTADILKASKANDVTVNSTLLTALSYAMVAVCQQEGLQPPKALTHNVTVDIRKKTNFQTPQPMGNYIGCIMPKIKVTTQSDLAPEMFWNAARNYGMDVNKLLKDAEFLKSTSGLYRYLYEAAKNEEKRSNEVIEEMGMHVHLSVSNLGDLDTDAPPSESSVELTEQYVSLGGSPDVNNSFTPVFFFVAKFKGKLMWNMFYNHHWVSRDFASKLIQSTEDLLKRMCFPAEEGEKVEKQETVHVAEKNKF